MQARVKENQRTTGSDLPGDYELRYRIMSESVAMGLFRIDPGDGNRLLSVNRVMARMLGCDSPKDLAGKSLNDLVISPGILEELTSAVRTEGSAPAGRREVLMKRADGSEIWVSLQAWKLEAADGSPMTMEGFAEDITESKVSEQEQQFHESELNRYALELSLANRKLNILSSITRHDILNKLTGMQGYLELMKGEYSEPKIQEYLAIQETIMDAISRQIQFTRDYQEIGIGNPRWFDVRETIFKALGNLPLHPASVTADIDNFWIYADPMLEKVFYNLFDNSLRHSGKQSRIRCRTEFIGDGAQIIVEDDGNGIPKQFKEAIFLRKHFKNTGFGLYLSREILGITGLSIRETGTPGRNARFEITVPVDKFRIGDSAP